MQIGHKLKSALAVFIIHQALQDKICCRREPSKVRVLRQIFHVNAGLHKTLAAIGINQSGNDFQQGRFAGTIAPDQANAVVTPDR